MSNTADNVSQTVSLTGSGITGGAFMWAWLATNHDAITAVCAIIGAIIALSGFSVNLYLKFKERKK